MDNTMENKTPSLRVAIVGSGLAGLLIAQGLRKNGIHAVVYERDPSLGYRLRDWTLMIHWGLQPLKKLVPDDIVASLPQAYCDPFYKSDKTTEGFPCFNGSTGDLLYRIPATEAHRVSRQRCRRILSHGLNIQFDKKLANIVESEDHVTLVFEDETQEDADIVIGADGPSSKTREVLLGAEVAAAKRAPWVIATSTFSYKDAFKARFARSPHPMWAMAYNETGICALAVQEVKNPDEPADWEFTLLRFWEETKSRISGQEALDEVKQRTQNFCEPFRSAVGWIPDGSICHVDQLRYWVPVPWDNRNGRITLSGDAAHATLPFRGQGFNVTVEDATRLVNCLVQIKDGGSREYLMHEYDVGVIARGRETVLNALEEGNKAMKFNWQETQAAKMGLDKPAVQEMVPVGDP